MTKLFHQFKIWIIGKDICIAQIVSNEEWLALVSGVCNGAFEPNKRMLVRSCSFIRLTHQHLFDEY